MIFQLSDEPHPTTPMKKLDVLMKKSLAEQSVIIYWRETTDLIGHIVYVQPHASMLIVEVEATKKQVGLQHK